MTGNKILLTGATGFLGSHIAEELTDKGYEVLAIKRSSSNTLRCKGFDKKIIWVDIDDNNKFIDSIKKFSPHTLIHAAWEGASAKERDNWMGQQKNFEFLVRLLYIIEVSGIKKIIGFGSQSEYGVYYGKTDESYKCEPISAYGCIKQCSLLLLKTFAIQNSIEWYWLRLFSVFGPREDKNWLIPAAINNLLNKTEMDLTSCLQEYDYLYVKDFAAAICKVVDKKENVSGIYNLSTGNAIPLKKILLDINKMLTQNNNLLKFGAIECRENQVMKMQGDSSKFSKTFDCILKSDMGKALNETIEYYKSVLNDSKL